jgi:hypothetical protein
MEIKRENLQNLLENSTKASSIAYAILTKEKDNNVKKLNFEFKNLNDGILSNNIYTMSQWKAVLSDPRNIIIRTADISSKEKYFTVSEIEDKVAKMIHIKLNNTTNMIPLKMRKNQTTADYYKNVFIPMTNRLYSTFSLDDIESKKIKLIKSETNLDELSKNLNKFSEEFKTIDRTDGDFWRSDNPKRHDKVDELLTVCLKKCTSVHTSVEEYIKILNDIVKIITHYSNYAEKIASNLESLEIDSHFDIGSYPEGISPLSWLGTGTNLYLGVTAIGILALASLGWLTVAISGAVFVVISIVNANSVKNWYENSQKKLEPIKENLEKLDTSVNDGFKHLTKVFENFRCIANKINIDKLSVNNADDIAMVFHQFIGEFNDRLSQESKLSNIMKNPSLDISSILKEAKKIIDDVYPYEGEYNDDATHDEDEDEIWKASNKNKYTSLALKWLLVGYGKVEALDTISREKFKTQIISVSKDLKDKEIERLMIIATFIHSTSPSEALKQSGIDAKKIKEIEKELIDNYRIPAQVYNY